MLPELLFSVSSSMQDISNDDFGLLNGECDKDVSTSVIITTTSAITRTNNSFITSSSSPSPPTAANLYDNYSQNPSTPPPLLQQQQSLSTNSDTINHLKSEDSNSNPFSSNNLTWNNRSHHQHQHDMKFESSKLLLQNSDDPLISRGAAVHDDDDDHPNKFKSIVEANETVAISKKPECIITSSADTPKPTKNVTTRRNRNQNLSPSSKPRRKSAFKLRFHHQALPPEYLSHYEMTQNQQNKVSNSNVTSHNTATNNRKTKIHQSQAATEKQTNSHETVRNWLEKISQITNISDNHKKGQTELEGNANENLTSTLRTSKKIFKYSDLPYMGEITLNNSKPRRGRKPKKADICHLIYKNYGTILPGTPQDKMEIDVKDENQHSLLEKCLSKDLKGLINKEGENVVTPEEPLNLCLRDQSEDFFILSSDDENSDELGNSGRTSPMTVQSDPITDTLLAANLKMSLPNFKSALLSNKSSNNTQTSSTDDRDKTKFPCWPGSEIFLHPMSLYYQKLIDSRNTLQSSSTSKPTTSTTTTTTASHSSKSIEAKTKQRSSSKFLKLLPTPKASVKRETSNNSNPPTPGSTKSSTSTTNTSSTQNPVYQKRKRSAIFIPPMPAENTTNPATEVSICKFKFTGGAKPSLQEKKMLSVDSDGNYRYYSGTGDKSMRGYEFFPRETLQQSGVVPGVNCSGAFLNATGEKILGDFPNSTPSPGFCNELLQIPDLQANNNNFLFSNSSTLSGTNSNNRRLPPPPSPSISPSSTSSHQQQLQQEHQVQLSSDRRKRKSRRSVQREKLEQTFKEKGFLIQTQQLESAEGATYCKFRQLRKFTRYLFRSWKDYLPSEIQKANAAAVAAAAAAAANQQTLPLCDMIEATNGNVHTCNSVSIKNESENLHKCCNSSNNNSNDNNNSMNGNNGDNDNCNR